MVYELKGAWGLKARGVGVEGGREQGGKRHIGQELGIKGDETAVKEETEGESKQEK